MSHKQDENDIEREQVEALFGLGGGELENEPWEFEAFKDTLTPDYKWTRQPRQYQFVYWFEGVPDYLSSRDVGGDKYGDIFRTVVRDCLFGYPPTAIRDAQGIWKRVFESRSAGEAECPWQGVDGEPTDKKRRTLVSKKAASNGKVCDLCEADIGEPHGYIYLGDGWVELVYKLMPARYLESEEAPRRESHQRTALTKRTRTPMQEHGKPVDFAKRRRAVSGYLIEERGEQWQRREPGGKYHIRAAHGEDRIIDSDYTIHDRYPGKYETEAEAEAVARSLFPNAKRVRY